MIIISELSLPGAAGTHQVSLDPQSAEMLRALAGAWNERRVVRQVRMVAPEQDHPEVRGYIERDMTLALQDALARGRLTALWVRGPAWWKAAAAPKTTLADFADESPYPPLMPWDWVCCVEALAVPMATWDGTSWAPK